MPHLVTCPRCAHGVDTWVAEGETTHCEQCGARVDVPEDAEPVEQGPPVDVVRERGRLAGLDPAPHIGARRPWSTWSDGTPVVPMTDFQRGVAWTVGTLFCLTVLVGVLLLVARLAADYYEVDPHLMDVTGLVVVPEHPDAPFTTRAELQAAIESLVDGDAEVSFLGKDTVLLESTTSDYRHVDEQLDAWRTTGR